MSVNDWVERLGGPDGLRRYRRSALASVGFFPVCEVGLWALWAATTDMRRFHGHRSPYSAWHTP